MVTTTHNIVPDGNVVLVLHDPDPEFAVWDDQLDYPSVFGAQKKDGPTLFWGMTADRTVDSPPPEDEPIEEAPEEAPEDGTEAAEEAAEETVEETAEEAAEEVKEEAMENGTEAGYKESASEAVSPEPGPVVEMRLSSSHLILASSYFKSLLQSDWKESDNLRTQGIVRTELNVGHAEALLIIMNVIHGRTRSVPRDISLEMLAKIAVLVDFLECSEVMEIFSDMWIERLRKTVPRKWERDAILWIWISKVFNKSTIFSKVTRIAIMQARGPIPTLGLPISEKIAGDIDEYRKKRLEEAISTLHKYLRILQDGTYICENSESLSFQCSCMLLGALTKGMYKFPSPRPEAPFIGFSLAETKQTISEIESPKWYSDYRRSYTSHACTLETLLERDMEIVWGETTGLSLQDTNGS